MHYYSSSLPCSLEQRCRRSSIVSSSQHCSRTPWRPCINKQQVQWRTNARATGNSNADVSPLSSLGPGSHHVQAGISSSTAAVSAAAVASQQAVQNPTSSSSIGSSDSSSSSGFGLDAAETAADATEAHAAAAQRLSGCLVCQSSGRVPCKECDGRGFLKRGGYMKKNPLNMSRITGRLLVMHCVSCVSSVQG
jgi:hypothetical protein